MEVFYKNRYRISPARLASWDYGPNGAYFITICTKDRNRYFGEIEQEPIVEAQPGSEIKSRSETRSIAESTKRSKGDDPSLRREVSQKVRSEVREIIVPETRSIAESTKRGKGDNSSLRREVSRLYA